MFALQFLLCIAVQLRSIAYTAWKHGSHVLAHANQKSGYDRVSCYMKAGVCMLAFPKKTLLQLQQCTATCHSAVIGGNLLHLALCKASPHCAWCMQIQLPRSDDQDSEAMDTEEQGSTVQVACISLQHLISFTGNLTGITFMRCCACN